MSNKAFVLYLNNNLLGIFDNENTVNNFIKGGVQNKFFSNQNIRIEQFVMNSCYKLEEKLNNQIPNVTNNLTKEELQDKHKKLGELYKSESFQKVLQEKIDLVSEINRVKYDKKLMVEKNNLYNEDVKLFELFSKEKEKNNNFIIPELFQLKFSIFDSLTKENNLSFETFIEKYEKVKPENNYDMFTSNTYEKNFESSENNFEMEFELSLNST